MIPGSKHNLADQFIRLSIRQSVLYRNIPLALNIEVWGNKFYTAYNRFFTMHSGIIGYRRQYIFLCSSINVCNSSLRLSHVRSLEILSENLVCILILDDIFNRCTVAHWTSLWLIIKVTLLVVVRSCSLILPIYVIT